ncbi:MAG: SAM-dependent methyltransferase, partial [Verrucomicrobiae bacterium]|nr:SAM-dependent methyltransferase [Verrucomicrobiae bacterium]
MSSPLPPPRNFRPGAFAYHDEIELVIVGLDDLGCGYGIERGVRVLVPFTLPGEKVRARIYANRSTHSDADLMAILEPSPDRVKPVCSLFGQCGGCQFQQWDYAAQLRWKHAQVKKLFEAIAPGVDVNSVIASPR